MNPVPVLKWVGGKRQLLHAIAPLIPRDVSFYCEPFVGGGAVLFHVQPKSAWINDINEDLIRVYRVIQEDVEGLIRELSQYENTPECFYAVRDWDRDRDAYARRPEVQKAARILYLNKTCYNGLYRVNNAGEFNSPFGHYRNPNIVNGAVLRSVSAYFRRAEIRMTSLNFEEVLPQIPGGAFVYLDPPYDPVSETSNFTGYARGGFSREQQIRLRQCCDDLHRRGIRFLLSNSATDFIREQYAAYPITTVQAKRAVNSDPSRRGDVEEVLVRNYA